MRLIRVLYRLGQGWQALRPRLDPGRRRAALEWLPAAAQAAFMTLPVADQCHHLAVFEALYRQGCRDEELLQAALLHDIGKIDGRRYVHLWQRTVVVLIRPWPALSRRLAATPAPYWRYGFYLQAEHPALGAQRARTAGLSERAVQLIASHQADPKNDPALIWLRAVDDSA